MSEYEQTSQKCRVVEALDTWGRAGGAGGVWGAGLQATVSGGGCLAPLEVVRGDRVEGGGHQRQRDNWLLRVRHEAFSEAG
jgi:hypothetical protein